MKRGHFNLSCACISFLSLLLVGCDPAAGLDNIASSSECQPASILAGYDLSSSDLDSTARALVDSVIVAAIADSAFPAAAIAVGSSDQISYLNGYGTKTYDPDSGDITPKSVFDLASMTKVIATTTATMLLVENRLLDLDDRVVDYLPEFGNNGKESVTIRHLLTHTSGLVPFQPFHRMGIVTKEDVLSYIMNDTLRTAPGTVVSYSDFGLITMGRVIESITGMTLNQFASTYIFNPLGMCDTGFRSRDPGDIARVVPTEYDSTFRQALVHGVVHDETSFSLGGVAGHAGLFSTAADLSIFASMMLSGGMADSVRFLEEETIASFTKRPVEGQTSRAIGWDLKSLNGYSSSGRFFSLNSFGHTGYTGTSIWLDPETDMFAILLTNRVHPTRANRKISQVRPDYADAVATGLSPRLPE